MRIVKMVALCHMFGRLILTMDRLCDVIHVEAGSHRLAASLFPERRAF